MATSTQLVNTMVSTTGGLITAGMPFFYIFAGFLLAFIFLMLIWKTFSQGIRKML